MNKIIRPVLITGIALVVLGLILYPKIKPLFSNTEVPAAAVAGPRALNVNAMVLKHQKLVEIINSSGTLIPDEQVDLSFEASGKLITIHFNEGTRVSRGQLLAKINDRPLQAQLQKLQAQQKLAEEREFRQKSLLSRDAISQESYDQVVTELASIQADIMLIQARISETELKAPFDGVIGLRHVSEGAFVNPSTQIARLIKNNPLKVEFAIPERYSGEIRTGFPIRFFLDGVADTLRGSVYAVDPNVDIRTRNVVVRARYSNPDERIKPGRFVSIQLEMNSVDNAISIPSESLIPEMEGDKVFVLRSGKAHQVGVKTGLRTEREIQIVEGLSAGDTLLTSGILQLRQGIPIQIDNIR
jgi:membrane fusion protein, multidrug efflux system